MNLLVRSITTTPDGQVRVQLRRMPRWLQHIIVARLEQTLTGRGEGSPRTPQHPPR